MAATYVVCLITSANSLDPDQDRHVGPGLNPNHLTLTVRYSIPERVFRAFILKMSADDNKSMKEFPFKFIQGK